MNARFRRRRAAAGGGSASSPSPPSPLPPPFPLRPFRADRRPLRPPLPPRVPEPVVTVADPDGWDPDMAFIFGSVNVGEDGEAGADAECAGGRRRRRGHCDAAGVWPTEAECVRRCRGGMTFGDPTDKLELFRWRIREYGDFAQTGGRTQFSKKN